MPSYDTLKGVTEIGDSTLCEQLKGNLIEFFNWGLLGVGGFFNVNIPSSGEYGGLKHKLKLVNDPNYSKGQVWEGFRKDWVWETGVNYPYQPIAISGVYVNGSFKSLSSTGTYAHHINHPLGQIVFDHPISSSSTVTAEYSYRYYQFYSNDVPWFQELQFNSFRVDDSGFLQFGSGAQDILAQNRVQLPAVVVEPIPRRKLKGMQLGGGQWVETDVVFHVLAETPWERDKIFDIITYQKDRTLGSFDKNKLAESGVYPLDRNGSLVASPKMYVDLAKPSHSENPYYWKDIFIFDVKSQEIKSPPPLYRAAVTCTFQIGFPEI